MQLLEKTSRKAKAVTVSHKPISPTSTGGVFIHLSPLKTMNAFREKALWENNQRILCQKDILKRQLAEVKETRKNIAELEAMRTAIKEVK